jgi:hypothetical protein
LFCAACSGGTEQPDNNKPFLPISDDGVVNVYGELIDVRSVEKDSVYPINDVYTYDESLPTEVSKLKCAVSVKELRGVEKIACSQACGVYVGSTEPISGVGWTDLGKSFTVSGDGKSVEYALYRYKIDKPMEWLDLPKLENQQASLLLFARDFKVQGTETFGTIIAKVHELRTANVTNPSIIRLPNGDLLAACEQVLRGIGGVARLQHHRIIVFARNVVREAERIGAHGRASVLGKRGDHDGGHGEIGAGLIKVINDAEVFEAAHGESSLSGMRCPADKYTLIVTIISKRAAGVKNVQ